MRAFAIQGFGQPPSLLDLPIPVRDDQFLIRITCAGVNPIDYKLAEMLTASSRFPFVFGIDFTGVIERLPMGNTEFSVGDRVFGMARTYGSYAEYTAVSARAPGEPLARIPDEVSDDQAAVLPVAGVAALGSIDLTGIGNGQSLVILGATGGVGGYAVQLARVRGIHVIATSRGDGEEARRLGCNEIYDANDDDVLERIRAAHPRGVDAVLDLVNGKDTIAQVAQIIKPGGSLVSAVRAADEVWFRARQITVHNLSAQVNPKASQAGLEELVAAVAIGQIDTRISFVTDLYNAQAALDRVRHGGLHGKAIVRPQVV